MDMTYDVGFGAALLLLAHHRAFDCSPAAACSCIVGGQSPLRAAAHMQSAHTRIAALLYSSAPRQCSNRGQTARGLMLLQLLATVSNHPAGLYLLSSCVQKLPSSFACAGPLSNSTSTFCASETCPP